MSLFPSSYTRPSRIKLFAFTCSITSAVAGCEISFGARSAMRKVESIVFHVSDPSKYIERIHFGPQLPRPQARELVIGAIAANLFGKMRDVDKVYKKEEPEA